jgi:hypothetical protein
LASSPAIVDLLENGVNAQLGQRLIVNAGLIEAEQALGRWLLAAQLRGEIDVDNLTVLEAKVLLKEMLAENERLKALAGSA